MRGHAFVKRLLHCHVFFRPYYSYVHFFLPSFLFVCMPNASRNAVFLKVRIGSYFCLQVKSTVIVIESNVGGEIEADTDIAAPLSRPSPSPSARPPPGHRPLPSAARSW